MSRLLLLALLPALIVALPPAPAAPAPKVKPVSPYFPTAVGTKWVYVRKADDGHQVVWSKEAVRAERLDGGVTRVTVQQKGDSDDVYDVGRDGLVHRTTYKWRLDIRLLPHPPRAGDGWDVVTPVQAGLVSNVGRKVCGEAEAVTVPAGTYRAVPVRFTIREKDGRLLADLPTVTYWYAPGVGEVKRAGPGFTLELTEFTSAGK